MWRYGGLLLAAIAVLFSSASALNLEIDNLGPDVLNADESEGCFYSSNDSTEAKADEWKLFIDKNFESFGEYKIYALLYALTRKYIDYKPKSQFKHSIVHNQYLTLYPFYQNERKKTIAFRSDKMDEFLVKNANHKDYSKKDHEENLTQVVESLKFVQELLASKQHDSIYKISKNSDLRKHLFDVYESNQEFFWNFLKANKEVIYKLFSDYIKKAGGINFSHLASFLASKLEGRGSKEDINTKMMYFFYTNFDMLTLAFTAHFLGEFLGIEPENCLTCLTKYLRQKNEYQLKNVLLNE